MRLYQLKKPRNDSRFGEYFTKVRGGLKTSDRWLMQKKIKGEIDEDGDVKMEESGERDVKLVIPALRVSDALESKKRGRRARDELAEELDFEEDFQDGRISSLITDDGLMDLGIEDEEDRKEATRRTLGGARTKTAINFDDDDDEIEKKDIDKRMKKTLERFKEKKNNDNDLESLSSDSDRDPYASEEVFTINN